MILGADIKLKISLKGLGEDVKLDDISYKLEFTAGRKTKTYEVTLGEEGQQFPTGVARIDDETVRVSLPTSELDSGDLFVLVSAKIQDSEFPDGFRDEIVNHDTGITLE